MNLVIVYGKDGCEFCQSAFEWLTVHAEKVGAKVVWQDAARPVYGKDERDNVLDADVLSAEGTVTRYSALLNECNGDLPLIEIDGKYYNEQGAKKALLRRKP